MEAVAIGDLQDGVRRSTLDRIIAGRLAAARLVCGSVGCVDVFPRLNLDLGCRYYLEFMFIMHVLFCLVTKSSVAQWLRHSDSTLEVRVRTLLCLSCFFFFYSTTSNGLVAARTWVRVPLSAYFFTG